MKRPTIFLLLVLVANPVLARGSRVTVALSNAKVVNGELLSVRDSALVIARKEYTEYTVNPNDRSRIAVIKFQYIDSVTVSGHSWRIWGAGFGYVGGALVGAAIANPSPSSDQTSDVNEAMGRILVGATIGSWAGVVAGYLLGDMASIDGATVTSTQPSGFLPLKEFSRYPEGEPEVLQSIQYFTVVY